MIKNLKNWFLVAKGAWTSLIIGYFWVTLSIVIEWKVPASGAILICTCLVAEIQLTSEEWNRFAFRFPIEVFYKVNVEGKEYYRTNEYHLENSTKTLDKLRAVARGKSLNPTGYYWSLSTTADDVNYILNWFITVSAVIGSVIWGYGDIWFKP